MSIIYRVGTEQDIPGLVLFLINFQEENKLIEKLGYDVKRCAESLREIIKKDQGVILLAEKDDKIIGAIGLKLSYPWWTTTKIFTDITFYVDPEYRATEVPGKLLNNIKEFSNQVKIPVLISVFKDVYSEKLERYLSIKGFKSVGVNSLYLPPKD